MRFSILGLVAINTWTLVRAGSVCRAVGSAASDLSVLGPAATEFCGSYLGIPATVTSYVVQTPTSILTVTLPTSTVSDASCPRTAKKRDVAVPTGLDKYASEVLSSACSRLSLAPTATTTLTGIASVATTSTVTAPAATATVCTGSTCTPDNDPCDIMRPDLCCGQACFCPSPGGCHCITF